MRHSLAPLKDLREGLRKIGEGDLSIKLKERPDDIGIINVYFNNTIEKFKGIIDKVRQTAEQVSSSSQNCRRVQRKTVWQFKRLQVLLKV